MERANTFIVEGCPALWELADNCARLYNEVNFERRQAYIRYKRFEWYPKHLYEKYAPLIGSATAQQIINIPQGNPCSLDMVGIEVQNLSSSTCIYAFSKWNSLKPSYASLSHPPKTLRNCLV